jgi:hypothetical protein
MNLVRRLVFLLLSTAVLIFFSEKVYWYTDGYAFRDLLLGYALPAFVLLWAVQTFRVRQLASLFLCAALYGLLVEGVLVGVIYEGGLFGWFNISYTPLAWHAPLSVIFGWYLLRRWLVEGKIRQLLIGCAAVGLFWGLWSAVFWLPESTADAAARNAAVIGFYPAADFALRALVFTAVLALAHGLLGLGGWQPEFRPSRIEAGLVLLILIVFFAVGIVPQYPYALLKLPVLLAIILLALNRNRQTERGPTVLEQLAGPVPPLRLLTLFAMPLAASAVYAVVAWLRPPDDLIQTLIAFPGIMIPTFAGLLFFVLALVYTFRPHKQPQLDTFPT